MITIQQLENICNSVCSRTHGESNVEIEDNSVRVTVRDGVDNEPSARAWSAAMLIKGAVLNGIEDQIKVEVETVDEWIDITFTIK